MAMTNEEVMEKLNEVIVHLRALQAHIDRIERELNGLNPSRRVATPGIPIPSYPPFESKLSICPVCGIDLDKAGMFVCINPACYNRITC